MRVLVIGGSGFVGRYICLELLQRGHEVAVFAKEHHGLLGLPGSIEIKVGDYNVREDLERAMRGVEVVYQLGGILGTAELTARGSAFEAVSANVTGHLHVLDLAEEMGITDIFFPSKPNEWTNGYSISKQAAERFSQMYSMYRGLQVRILRWVDIFGPGQRLRPVRKAVPSWCFAATRGLPLEVWGDGSAEVELTFAPDVAATTVDFMEMPWRTQFLQPLDAGCGARMTVNEVTTRIRELARSESKIVRMPMRPGQEGLWGHVDNCWKYTHQTHWTPFEDALRATIEFYRDLPSEEARGYMRDAYGTEEPAHDQLTIFAQRLMARPPSLVPA